MASLHNLKDLFIHHVKDLYNAETNAEKALPSLQNGATDERLNDILSKYRDMTTRHRSNLESIANEMEFDPTGETCHAMLGLVKEAQRFLTEDTNDDVMDAGIIADTQRIVHYFITGYGALCNWSEQLDLSDSIQQKCKQGIANAEEIDEQLKELAKSRVNEEAM